MAAAAGKVTWHDAIGRKDVAGGMDASAGERTCPAHGGRRDQGFGLRDFWGEAHIYTWKEVGVSKLGAVFGHAIVIERPR